VLNLVLILFCQDIKEEAERFEARAKGKGKNNRIPIMLIGQDRGGKTSLMRRLLGLPLNPSAMPKPVAL
jgi:GTPase SAR1 family protein